MKQAFHDLTLLRGILLILTLILLGWFLLPVLFGIVSLANLVAVPALGILALVLLRWKDFVRLLKTLSKRRGMRVLLSVLGIILAALVVLTAVLVLRVAGAMQQQETDAPTVIVLGCQVRGTRPSALLSHRIETAAEYLHAHPQARCIVSGGQGRDENISEAECMANGLIARGIAAERIVLEPNSTSTEENLEYSMQLMAQEGLASPVVIVSSNFHLYRALEIAEAQGLKASGLGASCEWFMLPTYLLREAMALVKFHLFG